jgi:plasmid stabilization system protein ParE
MQQGSGLSGAKRWAALREARSALRTHPYLGAPSEAFPGHRQHVVSSYRIIHRIDPDTGDSSTAGDVRIVTLFGPGER